MNDEFTKPRPAVAVPPTIGLVVALVLAIVLMVLPTAWTAPLKGIAAASLQPGQRVAAAVRHQAGRATGWAKNHLDAAAKLADAQRRIEQLETENRRLAAAAEQKTAAPHDAENAHDGEALLIAQAIPARVLGRQARAYLARQEMLNAGSTQGVQPEALVLDGGPPLVDRGGDAQLEPGRLVLAGRTVWGKVVEVGPYTSVVCRVTESGYRDVVRLAAPTEHGRWPRFSAEGILEGNGEPLARVRLVGVEEPVAVGDLVCAASADGVLDQPLVYGRIVRLERPVGATHWEIWMEPAAAGPDPQQVSILRIELNPRRVGSNAGDVRR